MPEEISSWDVSADTTIATTVVTESQLNGGSAMDIPAWARSILAICCEVVNISPTAAESVITKFAIKSDDIPLVPLELLGSPLGALLGATGAQDVEPLPIYAVNIPVKGGEKIKPYCTSLISSTGVLHANVSFLYSSLPPSGKQRYAKVGTLTASGTAAGSLPGTSYTITGASRIVEMMGHLSGRTMATITPSSGHIEFDCSAFRATPMKLHLNPIPALLGALGAPETKLSRRLCNMPVNGVANVLDTLVMKTAAAVAGRFIDGLIYEQ